ncbi:MAG: hypothetical protein MK110_07640 [Fuerstiella sp.]|nr:hypothetical protein [Fuerstiella sp.]
MVLIHGGPTQKYLISVVFFGFGKRVCAHRADAFERNARGIPYEIDGVPFEY